MTRQEHMDWSKKRALEIVDLGDTTGAYTSLVSDLGKHEETKGHPAIQLGMMMLMSGHLSDDSAMREFIKGFN